jgi:hypothetical protein
MRVRLFTACETSILDQRSNGLSLITIIDEMSSPSFPFIIPRLAIVTLFERNMDEQEKPHGLTVSAHLGDQELFSLGLEIDFQGKPRLRALADVGGLVIMAPGMLHLVLNHTSGTSLAEWDITIAKIGGPAATVTGAPADAVPKDRQPVS